MSFGRNLQAQGYQHGGCCPTFDGNNNHGNRKRSRINYHHGNYDIRNHYWAEHGFYANVHNFDYGNYVQHDVVPSSLKRRKHSTPSWENNQKHYLPSTVHSNIPTTSVNFQEPPSRSNVDASISPICKLDCSIFEDKEPVFMSRDEIDRCSPSRKDGIDVLHERHLRYSYCAFIQNLGMWLNLPQTTIGTAMVLCHRFFVRRSHACHDRFLISTAALFLAGKSEDTPCPLNSVLRASSEILYKKDFTLLCYLLPLDWFEKYHDRVLEAELLLLTTLNFELNVQHPYAPLTSILDKLGPSKTILVNLALNLISKGLQSSLWLQYKPHHIAAGAAYLASKFLKIDLTANHNIWQEFGTTPSIIRDISQQLMELV
ncbi:cyclin-T1-3 isoform X1 [Vigna radiata var. radiata]|uniref:B-like cyclin n=1 Tax=Vigna radiata var. radiata TaxID=3916 RepID=A0A1S3VSD4_VIGRR|nr:cyclin-T1-3 isoform X1 [Vigna radiata var. radiata]XP_014521295.1 cyclin-T1-3 isoform X1 [Vigna radiata var. radiata]